MRDEVYATIMQLFDITASITQMEVSYLYVE